MKKFKIVIMAFLTTAICIQSKGQSDSLSIIRPIGIGFHLEQFKTNRTNSNFDIYLNKFTIPISINKKLRIEPEIGFNLNLKNDNEYTQNCYEIGIGTFRMIQVNRINTFVGLRLAYQYVYNSRLSPTNSKLYIKTNRISIAPSLGMEAFVIQNFSIGGEISVNWLNINTRGNDQDNELYLLEEITNYSVETGLFFRFYF